MGYVDPYMVWCSLFGYEGADGGGGHGFGQRDGQGEITKDCVSMPKNWNLKPGVKGSHCRICKLDGGTARFAFWILHSGSQE